MLLSTCKLVLSLDKVDEKTKDKIKGRIEKAKMAMQKQDERYKKMCQVGFQNDSANPCCRIHSALVACNE